MTRNNPRTTKQKMSTQKKWAAGVAIILILTLSIGGAFAWTDFRQFFINRHRGAAQNDVLLHDDFEPGVNKDVYVENTGDIPLIVRVQFREYFQIGDAILTDFNGTNLDPKKPRVYKTDGTVDETSSWPIHTFPVASMLGTGSYGEFDTACTTGSATHGYWVWQMTGAQKAYKSGTSKQGNYNYTYTDGTDGINLTLAAKPVMTVARWNATIKGTAAEETLACWLLDSDGWCYWSQPLLPSEATNLLLDDVKLLVPPDDNYAYFIDVYLQACNYTEREDMINEGGNSTLIEDIADRMPIPTAPSPTPAPTPSGPWDFDTSETGTNPQFAGSKKTGSINVGLEYTDGFNSDIVVGIGGLTDGYPLGAIIPPGLNTTGITATVNSFTLTTSDGFFLGQTFGASDLAPGSGISFSGGMMIAKLAPKWSILYPFLDGCYSVMPYMAELNPLDVAIDDIVMRVEVEFTLSNGDVSSPYEIVIDFNNSTFGF